MCYIPNPSVALGVANPRAHRRSSSRQLWVEGFEDHLRMHVVWLAGLAELGSTRGGRHQADQVCVSDSCVFLPSDGLTHEHLNGRYDHGIQTFDTANVSFGRVRTYLDELSN